MFGVCCRTLVDGSSFTGWSRRLVDAVNSSASSKDFEAEEKKSAVKLFQLKAAVAKLAHRAGYKVERLIDEIPSPLDVFGVLVHRLAELRGQEFSFIQIGAHDGKSDDPIRKYVEAYRWRGVLVEPQPAVFAKLLDNYRDQPQLSFENAAVAAQDGEAVLYMPADAEQEPAATFLATFDKAVLQRRIGRSAPIRELRVPAVTVRTLLAKYDLASPDLLQIDAEGFDFEIIKMFDECGVRPSLIRFEHYNIGRMARRACFELLAARNYRLWRDGIDIVACQPILWETPATRSEALPSD